jgi:glycosyltransferase involved in cell wall biosynthesis
MPSEEAPFISICIPVFNGESFVQEAIQSVLLQDYPSFEVRVCENVSTDRTKKILIALEEDLADPRLEISYESEHLHLAANLNRAARMGTGAWILVLSADDMMLPGALQVLGSNIRQFPTGDLFIGQASYVVEGGDRTLGRSDYQHQAGPVPNLEEFVVGNSFPVNINATLLRSDLAVFREDCGVVCDLNLLIKLGQQSKNAVLIAEKIIGYREHAGATSSNRVKMWSESLAVYLDHLGPSQHPDLYRRRIFRMLFWCCAYLKGQGETARARILVEDASEALGAGRSFLLKTVLRLPLSIPALERFRALRRRLLKIGPS